MTNSLKECLIDRNGLEKFQDTKDRDAKDTDSRSGWLSKELYTQIWIAAPMICVSLLQYSLSLVSLMFVGHLGELALASASLATSITNVTGFHLLIGMSSVLETLCGQAFGAKQYHMLGTYLQQAIIVLNFCSIPIALIWVYLGPILRAIGQDPEIAESAALYTQWMLPTLFAYATLQPLVKFLQTQSAVLSMALCSTLTLFLHIPLCWLLVYKLGVGYRGAAIATATSQWLNVIFLVLYVKFGPTCKQTWVGFTTEAFHDMKSFFKLAVPSAAMICLEYWSFELMVLLSGLLPDPKLEMSSLSVCLNTFVLLYQIPYGLSASVSTRVSNELGAGKAFAAKRAVMVGLSLALTEGLIMSTVAFFGRHVWTYAFTNEAEVIAHVAATTPFLCVNTIMDSCQVVLSGVTRGCGQQSLGAYTNVVAYYVVGVPLAAVLAFHYHMNGKGLWLGLMAALVVQTTGLGLIALYTDWEHRAQKALNRVYDARLPIKDNLLS